MGGKHSVLCNTWYKLESVCVCPNIRLSKSSNIDSSINIIRFGFKVSSASAPTLTTCLYSSPVVLQLLLVISIYQSASGELLSAYINQHQHWPPLYILSRSSCNPQQSHQLPQQECISPPKPCKFCVFVMMGICLSSQTFVESNAFISHFCSYFWLSLS